MAGHSKWSKVKRFKGALQCTFPTGSYDPIAGWLLLWSSVSPSGDGRRVLRGWTKKEVARLLQIGREIIT